MSGVQRVLATVALVVGLTGALVVVSAAARIQAHFPLPVPIVAQGPVDESQQRQLDLIERDLRDLQRDLRNEDRIRIAHLAAVEREVEIDRLLIYGFGLGLVSQLALSGLVLRRLNRR